MSQTKTKLKSKKGIGMEELLGISLQPYKRISSKLGRIAGSEDRRPIIIAEALDGEYEGRQFKFGLVTQAVVDRVLEEAEINGSEVILNLPSPDNSKEITWVNFL